MDHIQEVRQLELLCKQLYESQDSAHRAEAEKALVAFQNAPDTLTKCQLLLDRGDSAYAQLLAATTLTKLVSRSAQGQLTTTLSLQQRLDIRKRCIHFILLTQEVKELNKCLSRHLKEDYLFYFVCL